MGLQSSFKCSMWMFHFHCRGPRVVLIVGCYFELMLLLFNFSDSKICESINSQRGDLCEMLKKKKSSVFETIKLQKVRYISNIVLTHLFCTQDTTYCNQFCWWWVFCLLLDFFTFFSVHVRERERERPLAYDPFSEGEL